MSIIKGFGQINSLINNTHSVVSPIGEMSANSKTYVRDITTFTNNDFSGVALLGLISLDDNLIPNVPSMDQQRFILEMITWIQSKARSGEIGPSVQGFEQLFVSVWDSQYRLLTSGQHVQVDGYWYPSSISFAPATRYQQDNWTIWLSDEHFSNEFDDTIIEVIPPLSNLDQFFNTATVVRDALAAVTSQDMMDKIAAVRGKDPYTVLRMDPFDWQDPNNVDIRIHTDWTVVIYGKAGDNIDRVKLAIIDYVLSHSLRPSADWSVIFPDIFRSTEMIVAPAYFAEGVPNQQTRVGVYSGISKAKDLIAFAKQLCKGVGYTQNHIENQVANIPTPYRGLQAAVVAGPENRIGYETFRKVYWDYLNVHSTHSDFMRMREVTRQMYMKLSQMVDLAEKMTPTSVVPAGFNRVEREGVWYLSTSLNNLLLLVVSKFSSDAVSSQLDLPTDR